jgi:hypothetical protein
MASTVYDAVSHLEDELLVNGVLETRFCIGRMVAGRFNRKISPSTFNKMMEVVSKHHSRVASSITFEYSAQGSEELVYSAENSDVLSAVSRVEHVVEEVHAEGTNPFVVQVTAATEKTIDAGVKTGQQLQFKVRKTRTTFVERCWKIHFSELEFNGAKGPETSYEATGFFINSTSTS